MTGWVLESRTEIIGKSREPDSNPCARVGTGARRTLRFSTLVYLLTYGRTWTLLLVFFVSISESNESFLCECLFMSLYQKVFSSSLSDLRQTRGILNYFKSIISSVYCKIELLFDF